MERHMQWQWIVVRGHGAAAAAEKLYFDTEEQAENWALAILDKEPDEHVDIVRIITYRYW